MSDNREDAETANERVETAHRVLTAAGATGLGAALLLELLAGLEPLARFLAGFSLLVLPLPVAREAVEGLQCNRFNEHVLMSMAVVVAGIIGVWLEGAAVLLVYNVAEDVEEYTVHRIRKIAERTASLLRQRVLRIRGGREEEVAVEEIRAGDVLLVKTGWRIPVDGIVVRGRSTVDQSAVTGESIPAEKDRGMPSCPEP